MSFNFDFEVVSSKILRDIQEQIPKVIEDYKKSPECNNEEEAIVHAATGASVMYTLNILHQYHEELNKYLEKRLKI